MDLAKLQFSYPYKNYCDYEACFHPSDGWKQRKVIAIPEALWNGIVQVVYHLMRAVFYGIPKACCGSEKSRLKLDIYRGIRDIQEAFGWIITFFHDKTGFDLVKRSRFQKDCYSKFEELHFRPRPGNPEGDKKTPQFQKFSDWNATFVYGVRVLHYEEACNITLYDFHKMDSIKRQEAIQKFNLQPDIDLIGKEEFLRRLDAANESGLKVVTLIDLKTERVRSRLKYALLSDEEFAKVTLADLKEVPLSDIWVIYKRIGKVKDCLPDEGFNQNVLDVSIMNLRYVPGRKLTEVIEQIPPNCFLLLTDSQVVNIDLSKLSAENLELIFHHGNHIEAERRCRLLSPEQIKGIWPKLSFHLQQKFPVSGR